VTDFGFLTVATDETIRPRVLAVWAEENGFESIFWGEHTHVPVRTETVETPYFPGGVLPNFYYRFYDPFVAMAEAAAVTENLIVGSGICLLPIHDPIMLAKTIATIDNSSGGRVIIGIGAGSWNADEIEDYGVAFKDRWKVVREKVLAMREIWTQDEASYSGEFVSFEPLKAWPKPTRPGGPKILMGATSAWSADRIVDYCDGWLPADGGDNLVVGLAGLREAAERAGRDVADLDLTLVAGNPHEPTVELVRDYAAMGFNRILLFLTPQPAEKQWTQLEEYAAVLGEIRASGIT
jgi:probable F420-dependent oxidoreductase